MKERGALYESKMRETRDKSEAVRARKVLVEIYIAVVFQIAGKSGVNTVVGEET